MVPKIVLDPNLYVADSQNNVVRKVQLSSGTSSIFAGIVGQMGVKLGRLPARLNVPMGVAILPAGGLVILDENSVLLAPLS